MWIPVSQTTMPSHYCTKCHSVTVSIFYYRYSGVAKPGGDGKDISPRKFGCIPPIIWVWSSSASPPIIWLWGASKRRSPLEFEEKSVPFLVKTFFFWSSPDFAHLKLNLLTWKKSWSKFIPLNAENRAKLELQIIPPMLNKDSHHCR